MSGRIVKDVSQAITGSTATGYVTVASVTGFYERAHAFVSKALTPSLEVIITEIIVSTNTMGIRFVDPIGVGPDYGRDDMTAYNGGNISQPTQFISNPNDKPLD